MYAIVDLNGKQYQVEEGRYVVVDRVAQAPNEVLELGNVLMLVDGQDTLVGEPFVAGAKIRAKVLGHFRDAKVLVYKMRCKKGYRRKNGHRQHLTRLQVEDVAFPGRKAPPLSATVAEPRPAKTTEKPKAEKKPASPKKSASPKSGADNPTRKPASGKPAQKAPEAPEDR